VVYVLLLAILGFSYRIGLVQRHYVLVQVALTAELEQLPYKKLQQD